MFICNSTSSTGTFLNLQIFYCLASTISRFFSEQLEFNNVWEPSFASKWTPSVKMTTYSLIAIALSFVSLFSLPHIHPPTHTVPPSNHPLHKPTRKWQRKCARDQFPYVSHWHVWVTPLLSSVLSIKSARIHEGSEVSTVKNTLTQSGQAPNSHEACLFL